MPKRPNTAPARDEVLLFELGDRLDIVRQSHGQDAATRVAEAALAGALAAILMLGEPRRARPGEVIPRQPPALLFGSEVAIGTRAVAEAALAPLDAALDELEQRVRRVDRIANRLARTEFGQVLAELAELARELGRALGRLESRAFSIIEAAKQLPALGAAPTSTRRETPRRGRPAA